MLNLPRLSALTLVLSILAWPACQTAQPKAEDERAWLIQPDESYPLSLNADLQITSEEVFKFRGKISFGADLSLTTQRSGNSLLKLDFKLLSYQLKAEPSLKPILQSFEGALKKQVQDLKFSLWIDPFSGEALSFKYLHEPQRLESRASEILALFFLPRLFPGGGFEYSLVKPWELKIKYLEREIDFASRRSGVISRLSLFSPETPEPVGHLLITQSYRAGHDEDLLIILEANLITRTPIKRSGLSLVLPLSLRLSGRLLYGFNPDG